MGNYHHYLAEFVTGDKCKDTAKKSFKPYKDAYNVAVSELPPTPHWPCLPFQEPFFPSCSDTAKLVLSRHSRMQYHIAKNPQIAITIKLMRLRSAVILIAKKGVGSLTLPLPSVRPAPCLTLVMLTMMTACLRTDQEDLHNP